MKQMPFFSAIFMGLLIASGCANMRQEQALKDIEARLSKVENAQSRTDARLEEVNNKFLLLHEQIDMNKKEIVEIRAMAFPVAPPEGLDVVKPGEGETKKAALKGEEGGKKVLTQEEESLKTPEALYNKAQNLFMAGRLSEAMEKFANFMQHYPRHPLADNAQYWIGEAYYSQKDYQKALLAFKKVVDNYPNENKAPDALLKMGFSYMELNSREKGVEAFKLVVERYSSSEAAIKAKAKMQELQK